MTSIRNPKIEIPTDVPFSNCKLGREKYAEILKAVVQAYSNGFVLGLDGAWGTGKTTFLQMWKQYLIINDFKCVYINAWENDFVSDPMSMILGEFQEQLINKEAGVSKTIEDKFEKTLEGLAKISKSAIPKLLETVLKSSTGVDFAKVISKIAEASTSILTEEVKAHEEKKNSFSEFKRSLKEVVEELTNEQPIVVLVDELDRCNPHFAVKVLERVKHFFDIEGMVFVLSVDAQQLSHSVRGYYGSERIEAEEYLRRFIDLWFDMPAPDYKAYCHYLYDYYRLGDYFEMSSRMTRQLFKSNDDELKSFSVLLSGTNKLSLRQIEKLFIRTKVALNSFTSDQKVLPSVFYILIFFKEFKSDVYRSIKLGQYSIHELVSVYEDMIAYDKGEKSNGEYGWEHVFVMLVCMYREHLNALESNRDFSNVSHYLLKSEDGNKGNKLAFEVNKLDERQLISLLEYFTQNHSGRQELAPLSHLLDKLELLDHFVKRD